MPAVGDREVHDLAAAVAWARELGHTRVATVGFWMGGSVVLRHAALHRGPDGGPDSGSGPGRGDGARGAHRGGYGRRGLGERTRPLVLPRWPLCGACTGW